MDIQLILFILFRYISCVVYVTVCEPEASVYPVSHVPDDVISSDSRVRTASSTSSSKHMDDRYAQHSYSPHEYDIYFIINGIIIIRIKWGQLLPLGYLQILTKSNSSLKCIGHIMHHRRDTLWLYTCIQKLRKGYYKESLCLGIRPCTSCPFHNS